jgi:hypothetical protein
VVESGTSTLPFSNQGLSCNNRWVQVLYVKKDFSIVFQRHVEINWSADENAAKAHAGAKYDQSVP